MKPPPTDAVSLREAAEAKLATSGHQTPESNEARIIHELQVHQIELELQNQSLQEAQAEVEAGLERYTDLYDFAPAGYFTLESNGAIRELNLAGAQMLATERAGLVGKRFGIFVAEASRADFQRFLDRVFSSDTRQYLDVELAIEGQGPLTVAIGATRSPNGRECRAVVVDITERRRAEDALRASEGRFRLLVEAVSDYAIYLLDPDGRVSSWNAGAQRLKGYAPEEIVGQHVSVFFPVEDRGRGEPERQLRVAAAEGRFEREGWRARKDGSLFWANVITTPVRDAGGRVVGFAQVAQDLSERRIAERRFRLIECAPDGILLVDGAGSIVHANPKAATMFGYTQEELIGLDQEVLVPERLRLQHRDHRALYMAAPTIRSMGTATSAVVGLRKDGTEFPAELSLGPLEGPDAPLIIAFVRDVSELREMQRRQVRAADRVLRLHTLAVALGEAVDLANVAAAILSGGLDAVGVRAGLLARVVEDGRRLEILGETGAAPDEVEDNEAVRARDFGGETVGGRQRIPVDAHLPLCDTVRSGAAIWLHDPAEVQAIYPALASLFARFGGHAMVCLPLISRGAVLGVLRLSFTEQQAFDDEERFFLTSIAHHCAMALDRAQLYEEAILARDAAAHATMMRDEFLSIVAHDLSNPLNTVRMSAINVLRARPGGEIEMARKAAGMIGVAVEQMNVLLRDLSDVAAIDSGQLRIRKEESDLDEVMTTTAALLSPLCAEKGISFSCDAKAPSLRLLCDPNRVQQLLGNLVGNAIKFTPRGGRVTVDAAPSGAEVRFSVADTGPGIPAEVSEHVFERYWRGRERDYTKGVGLGLFIAKGIVDAHGGRIWLESVLGRGTTFYFTLPLAPG